MTIASAKSSLQHQERGRVMTKVVVSEATRKLFHDFSQPLEVCDESGQVLGRFYPFPDPARYEGLEPQVSREEIERRRQNKGKTYTTAEVLAYLEKL
jgi:hypothetical protein